ncbi:hypothetical protein SAY86_019559 [Trapa natans]|uniref:Flavin-containing monooxygenase n=1 Tax=Trapa natans TaxID=22666 RepID=A0AAN7R4U0_TRANT|nr:hypothetical protein SAY86_019559 [Trapa natans]
MRIGIIGAGVSGLLACKYALSKGFTPVVFEAGTSIGGVWTTPLETTRLQTPRALYRYSDHPWPAEVTDAYPTQDAVMGYIRSYADTFGLVKHVRFSSKVVAIEYKLAGAEEEMEGWHYWGGGSGEAFSSTGKWELTVEDTITRSTQVQVHEVDFVVLAIGRFSDVPNFPEFPPGKGPEAYRGEVVHSMDYAALDYGSAAAFVKGRRIAIVGLQKSALDIAMECSAANGPALPCTVVYRTEHWNVPNHMPWGVPLVFLYLNRLGELLLHKPREGLLCSLLATALSPVPRVVQGQVNGRMHSINLDLTRADPASSPSPSPSPSPSLSPSSITGRRGLDIEQCPALRARFTSEKHRLSPAGSSVPEEDMMRQQKGEVGGFLRRLIRAAVFHRYRINGLLPFFSALSACLLLMSSIFYILPFPPSSIHVPSHISLVRHPNALLSSRRSEDELAAKSIPSPPAAFHVPSWGGNSIHPLWSSRFSNSYHGCSNARIGFLTADQKKQTDGYLLIAASGGLNQQRIGIIDAVVAAYVLNATLIIPKLDRNSFWKDSSNFEDIFDVDWFILYLWRDVEILMELPSNHGNVLTPYNMRVPRKCTPQCYQSLVLPMLNKKHAVRLTKYDFRLSNDLENDLQKLRCRVNYHALKFTDTISELGMALVDRMKSKSRHFIALHLRFEPDMLAFSRCYYGGGDKERRHLGDLRRMWKNLNESDPVKERRRGKCPLTPEEVGLMLRALGFGSEVQVYVASGEVYGGEETLAPLKALFPNLHTKETLATMDELAPFSSYSSRMAALDFIVCDESTVLVTNNNGNMAKILAGRRRYFGHKPTIRPNIKKLQKLFMNRRSMTWEEFASSVQVHQVGFMGAPNESPPGNGDFHENPSACICKSRESTWNNMDGEGGYDPAISTDDLRMEEDDPDYLYTEYMENESRGVAGRQQPSYLEPESPPQLLPEEILLD